MSKKQATKLQTVDAIRDRLTRLHAHRGGWVIAAREARQHKGIGSCSFQEAWGKVEELTCEIGTAERDLSDAMRDAAVCVMPVAVVGELVQALDDIRMTEGGDNDVTKGALFDLSKDRARQALRVWQASQAPATGFRYKAKVETSHRRMHAGGGKVRKAVDRG